MNRLIRTIIIVFTSFLVSSRVVFAQSFTINADTLAAMDSPFEALYDSALVADSTHSTQTEQYLSLMYNEYLTGTTTSGRLQDCQNLAG